MKLFFGTFKSISLLLTIFSISKTHNKRLPAVAAAIALRGQQTWLASESAKHLPFTQSIMLLSPIVLQSSPKSS